MSDDGDKRNRLGRPQLGTRAVSRTVKQMKPVHRVNKDVIREAINEVGEYDRPQTRGDCRYGPRPCPWVACRHHLYIDVNEETGTIKINFPDLMPWELTHSCSIDVAEAGAITLEDVGKIMNLTRERIRQVEVKGLLRLKFSRPMREIGQGEPEESQED